MVWFLTIFAMCVAAFALACAFRFVKLRSRGYPVVVRSLPNDDARHWRHGVLVYSGTSAKLYKLRSLRPDSDLILTRLGTEIVARRERTAKEAHRLESDVHILEVAHRGKTWEIAMDTRGDTAMVAWLESAPSERRVRNSTFRSSY